MSRRPPTSLPGDWTIVLRPIADPQRGSPRVPADRVSILLKVALRRLGLRCVDYHVASAGTDTLR